MEKDCCSSPAFPLTEGRPCYAPVYQSLVRVRGAPAVASRSLLVLGEVRSVPREGDTTPALDRSVVEIQESLIWLDHYNGLVDGKLGPRTIAAIRSH